MSSPLAMRFYGDYKITVQEFVDNFLLDKPYEGHLSMQHYY